MSRHYMSSNAVCPFYREEASTAVYCEGTVEGSTLRLGFQSGEAACSYKALHCRGRWRDCPIARMLWKMKE